MGSLNDEKQLDCLRDRLKVAISGELITGLRQGIPDFYMLILSLIKSFRQNGFAFMFMEGK